MSSALGIPLRCERLSRSFDGTYALVDITLEFPRSGVVGIIGPNGAGKTTLLNVLSGFLRPDEGGVFLGERELTGLPTYRIARLGMARTFQDLRLIRQITVLENVLLAKPAQRGEQLLPALLRYGTTGEEARNKATSMDWLGFVGLEGTQVQLAGDLSYGQQKLLALACCLATEAQVLLLDEPVSGVHPEMVDRILGLLRQLRELGKCIIFIEHDIRAVREVADSVIVMDQGKVIAQGEAAEVLNRREIIKAYID